MPNKVVSENEVSINGVFFPIIGPVVEIPQNVYSQKQVFGDYTRDSNPRLSSITFSDFTGGIGLDTMQGFDTNRCWSTILGTHESLGNTGKENRARFRFESRRHGPCAFDLAARSCKAARYQDSARS